MKANLRFIDTRNHRMISLQILDLNIVKTSKMPVIVKIAIVNEERGTGRCAPPFQPVRRQFWEDKKWPPTTTECFSSF